MEVYTGMYKITETGLETCARSTRVSKGGRERGGGGGRGGGRGGGGGGGRGGGGGGGGGRGIIKPSH